MDWLSKAPVSEVTVCVVLSLFVQVTVVPTGTVIFAEKMQILVLIPPRV